MQEIIAINHPRRIRNWQTSGAAFAVFLFAVLLYARTLQFDFVWDDFGVIVHNTRVHSPGLALKSFVTRIEVPQNQFDPAKMVAHNYRPLRTLVHSLVWQGAGNNPLFYHLLNILGHGAVSMMLFLVLHRLLRQILPAFGGALLYAAHPVLTETVCWAKNFEDMMAGFFLLLTFYLILVMRRASHKVQSRYAAFAVFCFILALLSKISVVFFPVFLAIQWVLEKKINAVPRIFSGISGRMTALMVGIMSFSIAGVLAMRHLTVGRISQDSYIAGDCWTTWLSMPRMLLHYLRLEIVPVNLLADYQAFPLAESLTDGIAWRWAVFFVVVFAVVTIIAWRTRLTLPWLWFWCALLPVANIVPMMQLGAERFLYLPTIGFAFLGALLLQRIMRLSRSAGVLLALLCFIFYFLVFSFSTWFFSARWYNDMSLWRDTVEKSPEAVRPRKNLMKAFLKERRFKAALFHAVVLYRAAPTADNASYLGFLECMEANSDKGFERLVNLKADSVLNITGAAAAVRGRYDLAVRCFTAAIKINDKPQYRENLRRLNEVLEKLQKRKINNAAK